MTGNATSFGKQASAYAAARPIYPDALFDWIAKMSPDLGLVWDVGTGSGQAARSLAERFDRVWATDIDEAQIAATKPHLRIEYHVASAETSGLDDHAADAVTVATALHWFDFPRFWGEVIRVLRPGGLFVGWVYSGFEADPDVKEHLLVPILELVDPYWAEGNRLSFRGYPPEELQFPFEPIGAPAFACELDWTPHQIAGFLRTWSAHARARQDGKDEELSAIEVRALDRLGCAARSFRMPISVLAGRAD